MEKRSRGECLTCNNFSGDKVRCEKCQAKERKRRVLRENKRRELGLCILCGKSPGKSGLCCICFAKNIASWHFASTNRSNELIDLLHVQNEKCPYTGKKLILGENASLDHIIPKSRGGSDEITNLQWVYVNDIIDVNTMKWNMTHNEFVESLSLINEYLNGVK